MAFLENIMKKGHFVLGFDLSFFLLYLLAFSATAELVAAVAITKPPEREATSETNSIQIK